MRIYYFLVLPDDSNNTDFMKSAQAGQESWLPNFGNKKETAGFLRQSCAV
jgi:hypothetical protein